MIAMWMRNVTQTRRPEAKKGMPVSLSPVMLPYQEPTEAPKWATGYLSVSVLDPGIRCGEVVDPIPLDQSAKWKDCTHLSPKTNKTHTHDLSTRHLQSSQAYLARV